MRSRLAPTPSGYLHAGNAVNFLLTHALVRRAGGLLHLRIDDLDRERLRPAYVENIFDTLRWLEIDWDSGPRNPADFALQYSQLLRLQRYQALLEHLLAVPGLVYACTCSRAQIAATGKGGIYLGNCRHKKLPLDTPDAAWRVAVPEKATIRFVDAARGEITVNVAQAVGDFVIRKKDRLPAYQIASLADDVADQMTLIVRGEDLLPSTAAQLWLAGQAGGDYRNFEEVRFWHHALLTDAGGQKLSKSQQTPLDRGVLHDPLLTPEALRQRAYALLNQANLQRT